MVTERMVELHRQIYGDIRGRRESALAAINEALDDSYAIPLEDLERAAEELGNRLPEITLG